MEEYTVTDAHVPAKNVCPLCGHIAGYDPKLAALLDTVLLLIDVAHDLKAGLEEVAHDN
jgi:hypothetical protein